MGLPETVYVTRKAICQVYGINWYTIRKAVRAGVLHAVKLPRHKYARYLRREVIKTFGKEEATR